MTGEKPQRPKLGEKTQIKPSPSGDKGTGRLRIVDLRDGQYRYAYVKQQLPKKKIPTKRGVSSKNYRYWGVDHELPADQGQTSACTGFSEATVIMCGPVSPEGYETTDEANALGAELYRRALDLDEWAGNDPCCGSSVRAAAKAAMGMGLVGSFVWAPTVPEAADFVLNHGPAIAGIVWPDEFGYPDKDGYLNLSPNTGPLDAVMSGHAIAIVGVNLTAKNPDGSIGFFEWLNSWGTGWGMKGNGRCKVTFPLMGNLLMADGEILCPTEPNRKIKPVKVPVGRSMA